MKNIVYLTILSMLLSTSLMAQLDRSKQPQPGPAPKIQLGNYQMFTLANGLKVIVVENHKIPKVTYQLSLDVDPVLEGEFSGYTNFAGNLLATGTKTRTKAQLDEAIDFLGAQFSTSAVSVGGSVLKKHTKPFLEIMSDVLLNPVFPAEELEKQKKQNISAIQASKNEASAIADNINNVVLYGPNHPYGEIMSEKSIEKITIDKCREYYNTYFKPNVAYLVIVGDINLKEAKAEAAKYFGTWKKGVVPAKTYPFPALNKSPRVIIGNRDGAVQSYITVSFPLDFKPGNPDEIKASVMNSILGGGSLSSRINANLREKHAFTYGAYSYLNSDKLVGNFNASGEVKGLPTDTAMQELLIEINRMINEPVENEMVEQVKSRMAGSFARSLENPQTIARFALNIEKYKLPKDYYATYLEKLSKITPDDVRQAAQKYLKPGNANIIAVGNADMLKNSMKRFSPDGKVEMRDFYGNEVKPTSSEITVTANEVISRFINATGGAAKLMAVKDMTTKMSMTMQGMKIEILSRQKAPNKACIETMMGGKIISKQVFNGTKGKVKSPMGEQELKPEEVEEMKISSMLNGELYYEKMGIGLEVAGVEEVNGSPAWKLKLKYPSGKTSTEYYDQKTGYKVKTVGQAGQITFLEDYRDVDGVKIPFSVKQVMGPQTIELKVEKVDIGNGIEDSVFEF